MAAECVVELISVGSAVAKPNSKTSMKEWRMLEKCIVDYVLMVCC